MNLLLFPITFISGILTALSPCVLPILPVILGSGADGDRSRMYGVVTGIVVVLTLVVLFFSSVVRATGIAADEFRIFAAVILGLFGFLLLFPALWEKLQARFEQVFQLQTIPSEGNSFFSGFLAGGALGLTWTPCVGPIIAAVTTFAALQTVSLALLGISFSYALGVGIVLLAFGWAGGAVSQRLGWYKRNQQTVRAVFGALLIATALMIGTGLERRFQSWVLDTLPPAIANPVQEFEDRFGVVDRFESQSLEDVSGQRSKSTDHGEVVRSVDLQTDPYGAKVPPTDLMQGCYGKDCIPSIDDPTFVSVQAADEWLQGDESVFVLTQEGTTKIYPQRIMNRHEIVNDWYPNEESAEPTAIAVTFCPLCGTATAFERHVEGMLTEFGVSGKLYNSDLVMYDRYQGNLWQQATGEAIVGPAARRDEVLEPLFLVTLLWSQARKESPEAQVLSEETGFNIDYSYYPYGNYEENDRLLFPVATEDDRLSRKAWVYGIEVNGVTKAYPEHALLKRESFEDTVGGVSVRVKNDDGVISFSNLETSEEIVPLRSFWFAWVAFHPETELYTTSNK